MNKYIKYLLSIFPDAKRIYREKLKEAKIERENPQLCIGSELSKYKGTKAGKRCFVVGNGPSLTIEDLNAIANEDSFAANGIYAMYDKTTFRATYYFLGDPSAAENIGEKILIPVRASNESFFVLTHYDKYSELLQKEPNVNFYRQPIPTIYTSISSKFSGNTFKFKGDVSARVLSCGTITFEMLQFALYMGYSEIFLLGIDHYYSSSSAHFSGYGWCDMKNLPSNLSNWEKGYRTIEEMASNKGVTVLNATRGGHLEVFERTTLEDLGLNQ